MRGCGVREENTLYVAVPESPFGRPIDYFLVDPSVRFTWSRGPILKQDKKGVNHLVMAIGKTYYPFVPDFVEEARVMGISKKLAFTFDVSQLTPRKSRLILTHPRAIPTFEYAIHEPVKPCPMPTINTVVETPRDEHQCIADLWNLSSLRSIRRQGMNRHKVTKTEDPARVQVETPSTTYTVGRVTVPSPKPSYLCGMILMFPAFNFEWVNSEGMIPESLKGRMDSAGYHVEVCDE